MERQAMNRVFADTFYFLALLSRRDNAHAKAVSFAASFQGQLITTAWIIVELADALSKTPSNRNLAIETYKKLRQDANVRLLQPDAVVFQRGLDLFEQRSDKC